MLKNESWTERYRPKTFKEVVGIDTATLEKFCSTPKSMPHLLLHSKAPGTGKTTIGKVIIKTLGAESLFLNASDDRKIEVVREKIKRFVECMAKGDIPRIVFLDECDGMIKGSQEALRTLMEKYPAKFILTCNNIDKIIEPIQSRCVKIHLGQPKKEEILDWMKSICVAENLEYENDAIEKIVEINYPSIRDMINQLQMLSLNNKKITLDLVKKQDELFEELYNKIKEGKLEEARKEWLEKGLPLRDMLHSWFEYIFKDKSLKFQQLKDTIVLISETDKWMAVGADEDINLIAFCMRFRDILKSQTKEDKLNKIEESAYSIQNRLDDIETNMAIGGDDLLGFGQNYKDINIKKDQNLIGEEGGKDE